MLCRSHQVIAVFLWKVFDSLTLWLFSRFGIIISLLSNKNQTQTKKLITELAIPFDREVGQACMQVMPFSTHLENSLEYQKFKYIGTLYL